MFEGDPRPLHLGPIVHLPPNHPENRLAKTPMLSPSPSMLKRIAVRLAGGWSSPRP